MRGKGLISVFFTWENMLKITLKKGGNRLLLLSIKTSPV
jgi:hypothetical protein